MDYSAKMISYPRGYIHNFPKKRKMHSGKVVSNSASQVKKIADFCFLCWQHKIFSLCSFILHVKGTIDRIAPIGNEW